MSERVFSFPADVRYHHARVTDSDGVVQPKGGITVAYYIDHAQNRVVAALAICNMTDLFQKEEGRKHSLERLAKRINDNEQTHDKQGRPMTVIFTGEDMGRWAAQCVQQDLQQVWTESLAALFKPVVVADTLTSPSLFLADFSAASISHYQVGLIVDKVVDFFTVKFKL